MQKCNTNSTLGRSIPYFPKSQRPEYISISLRRFHGSHIRGQKEDNQAATSPFPRRGRVPATNQEINKLLETSASRPQVPQPASQLIRYHESASPTPKPSQNRSAPLGAIDARSLGASPPAGFSPPGRGGVRGGVRGGSRGGFRGGARGGFRGGLRGKEGSRSDDSPQRSSKAGRAEEEEQVRNVVAYLEEKRLREKPRSVIYEPAELTPETLLGKGPALALGEWGMSDVVHARLATIDAKHVEWAAKREAKVRKGLANGYIGPAAHQWNVHTERVKQWHEHEMDAQGGAEGEAKEEVNALTDEQKARFLKQLLDGQYVMGGKGDGGVLDRVNMLTSRNGSYFPRDGETVERKVSTLLPARKEETEEKEVQEVPA